MATSTIEISYRKRQPVREAGPSVKVPDPRLGVVAGLARLWLQRHADTGPKDGLVRREPEAKQSDRRWL